MHEEKITEGQYVFSFICSMNSIPMIGLYCNEVELYGRRWRGCGYRIDQSAILHENYIKYLLTQTIPMRDHPLSARLGPRSFYSDVCRTNGPAYFLITKDVRLTIYLSISL